MLLIITVVPKWTAVPLMLVSGISVTADNCTEVAEGWGPGRCCSSCQRCWHLAPCLALRRSSGNVGRMGDWMLPALPLPCPSMLQGVEITGCRVCIAAPCSEIQECLHWAGPGTMSVTTQKWPQSCHFLLKLACLLETNLVDIFFPWGEFFPKGTLVSSMNRPPLLY